MMWNFPTNPLILGGRDYMEMGYPPNLTVYYMNFPYNYNYKYIALHYTNYTTLHSTSLHYTALQLQLQLQLNYATQHE